MLDGNVRGAVDRTTDGADVGEQQLVQVAASAVLASGGGALVLGKLPGRVESRTTYFAGVIQEFAVEETQFFGKSIEVLSGVREARGDGVRVAMREEGVGVNADEVLGQHSEEPVDVDLVGRAFALGNEFRSVVEDFKGDEVLFDL